MSEIEKMMQNANVKKHWNSTPYGGVEEYYPPFTAEKQIKLHCFILSQDKYIITFEATLPLTPDVFAEGIAEATNRLWQDLTEEEKQQIKEILNG